MPYACTIVKLLEAGRDPSPPVGRIDFAIAENDERTLYVANTRLESSGIDLRAGDEIIGVGNRDVQTPTQFIDAARGHLDDLVLRLVRDHKPIQVRGRIPPAAKVTDRRGLWIDGALFAPVGDFYAGWLKDSNGLMVHHVDDSSEAASVGLQYFDVIERVNDKPVHTLEELERVVGAAVARKEPIELLLIRVMAEGDRLFEYERRDLSGEDVGRVGGP
jgi:S1-C subfamily serine protease